MSKEKASGSSGPLPPPAPPVEKPQASGIKKFFKMLYKVVSSHVGLILILIIYSFIGAAIFQVIEGPYESSEKTDIVAVRSDVIASLWNRSRLIKMPAAFEKIAMEELKRFEDELHGAFAAGVNSDADTQVWDFWGSLLYCATIYTTIGYGHIAPVTTAGRLVTMLYAIIGVPLCLIVMADLGKLFTRAIKFPWAFARRCYHTGECTKPKKPAAGKENDTDSKGDTTSVLGVVIDDEFDEFNLPPIVAILITVLYILLGAALYCQWEDWTYLEAFYFIFISISTIGFGDVLPEHPKYFLASSIYVLVGLSLVAMVINVIMEVVSSTIDKAKDKVHEVGKSMGIPMPDDDDEVAVKQD